MDDDLRPNEGEVAAPEAADANLLRRSLREPAAPGSDTRKVHRPQPRPAPFAETRAPCPPSLAGHVN